MSFTISLKIPLTIRTLSQLHVILMSVDINSINHCYLFLEVVEEFGTNSSQVTRTREKTLSSVNYISYCSRFWILRRGMLI